DLCALAVPASMQATPFGITLLAQAGNDATLASLGRVFHAGTGLPLGATGTAQPALAPLPGSPAGEIAIAVVGAHLTGMPLNGELKSFSARFLERTTTSADYRLFLLPGTAPAKPGLLRVGAQGSSDGGVAIDVEIWTMPAEQFGRFVASIPAP